MKAITPNGKATFTAGAAIAKGEFVKFSSGKVVKAAAATDGCIGVALDSVLSRGFVADRDSLYRAEKAHAALLGRYASALCFVVGQRL